LEKFPVLSQLPAVEQKAATMAHEILPHGKALKALLLQALNTTIERIGTTDDVVLNRIVE